MASYFKIPCPGCNKSLKIPDNLAGKSRACPYCRATVRIPEVPPAEPDNAFPNIQIAEKPAKGRRASKEKETVAKEAVSETATEAVPKPKPKEVKRSALKRAGSARGANRPAAMSACCSAV